MFSDIFWQKFDIFHFKLSPTFSKLLKKTSQVRRQIVFDTKTTDNHSKRTSLQSKRQGKRESGGEKILGRNIGEKILREFPSEAVCVVLSCSASGACLSDRIVTATAAGRMSRGWHE
jgi:hypothetical protein